MSDKLPDNDENIFVCQFEISIEKKTILKQLMK